MIRHSSSNWPQELFVCTPDIALVCAFVDRSNIDMDNPLIFCRFEKILGLWADRASSFVSYLPFVLNCSQSETKLHIPCSKKTNVFCGFTCAANQFWVFRVSFLCIMVVRLQADERQRCRPLLSNQEDLKTRTGKCQKHGARGLVQFFLRLCAGAMLISLT